jgi:ABC-type multidrug transport system fused ATPase/permease subunit
MSWIEYLAGSGAGAGGGVSAAARLQANTKLINAMSSQLNPALTSMNSFGQTMGKEKTRKSIKSATNMFKKMSSIMGATRLIMAIFNMFASMGTILEPFIALFELLGGLMESFMTPGVVALTKALTPTYQALAKFTQNISTSEGQLKAWNEYWDASDKEVWGVSAELEYLIEMIKWTQEVLSGTSTTTSGLTMKTDGLTLSMLDFGGVLSSLELPDVFGGDGGGGGDDNEWWDPIGIFSSSEIRLENVKTNELLMELNQLVKKPRSI